MKGFNRSFMTSFRLLLAVCLALSPSVLLAERVDDLPKPTDYVSDYAHVLSPAAIARLDSICTQLDHSQANAQVAIVTVRTLDGDDAADYASQLEDKWKIGKKGTDRGVLVLLAVDDHKRRIDVGYGLEGILPDAKVGDIGREMVPYLRANDFDRATLVAVGEIGQVIAEDAKITLDDEPLQQNAVRRPVHNGASIGKIIVIILVLLFFGGSWLFRLLFGLTLFSGLGGGRGGWGGGGGGGGGGSGFGGFGGGDFGGGGAGGDW